MTRKPRVMVVEDDRASRVALLALLRIVGLEPVDASNVADALQLLNSEHPRCLLLDLMLPDGSGATVLRFIREHALPVRVALTTGAADWRSLVGSDIEPDAVFTKPVDFDALSAWLTDHADPEAGAS